MGKTKTIALVAHDNRKKPLMEWVEYNHKILKHHQLVCTGTTGKFVEAAIRGQLKKGDDLSFPIIKLKSGPLGGDQQLGAMIAEGKVDYVIFLWDPMEPQPHDVDVKALNRIAVLYNIPVANNRATADFIITSELFGSNYQPLLTDYSAYVSRNLK